MILRISPSDPLETPRGGGRPVSIRTALIRLALAVLLLAAAAAALRFWPGRPIDRLERALAPETVAALPSISPLVSPPPDFPHPALDEGGSS